MKTVEILKELLNQLERYRDTVEQEDAMSMDGFLEFMKPDSRIEDFKSQLVSEDSNGILKHEKKIDIDIERILAQHLILLNRYIKFYSKTAFQDSKIKSLEEFSFMMTVVQMPNISKSELIKRNIIEKSSGIEIINRLIKNGLLLQTHNPNDLRSQIIQITDLGKMELYKIFNNMNTLGHIATAPLNNWEKQQLAKSLKKLDDFHYSNYCNKELKELEDYLKQKDNL